MDNSVFFSSARDSWETPKNLFEELDREFHFTLDAAASHENHKCDKYYTADENGLEQDWGVKPCFVILRMAGRKLAGGLKSVIGRAGSQGRRWLC